MQRKKQLNKSIRLAEFLQNDNISIIYTDVGKLLRYRMKETVGYIL